MPRITVLGGCGAIGSVAVRALATGDYFSEVAIADKRIDLAGELARKVGPARISVMEVDADDPGSVKQTLAGSSVVLNCIGPFYKYGPPILQAVIDLGIDYVDVCDDLDATENMLGLDQAAREAGVSAVIGMGNSPGLANIFARYCADLLLSQVDAVDIYHIHGGEAVEGAAVIKHRFHAMESDIPVFLDGNYVRVRMLEESGQALAEKTEFKNIGAYTVYPYPHPETITLPTLPSGPLGILTICGLLCLGLLLLPFLFWVLTQMARMGITFNPSGSGYRGPGIPFGGGRSGPSMRGGSGSGRSGRGN